MTTGVGVRGAKVSAMGTYAPSGIRTNADLAQIVETSDEWIVRRTGIRERQIARPDEFTSDLCRPPHGTCSPIGRLTPRCRARHRGTTTPDYPFPSVAALVQDRLRHPQAGAIRYPGDMRRLRVRAAHGERARQRWCPRKRPGLAGETLSKVIDNTDRATCILFGDGAGAALVEPATPPGDYRDSRRTERLRRAAPLPHRSLTSHCRGRRAEPPRPPGLIRQNGREVYRWAVETVSDRGRTPDARCRAHRMTTSTGSSRTAPTSESRKPSANAPASPSRRTLSSIECYGNTSAAIDPARTHGRHGREQAETRR